MAGIFTRFTLRSLAQNRVRTAVTVVGIALSTALLAAVLTSVASVQQGLLERTMVTEGSWHVFSPDVPAQGIDALVESDAVTDLATFRDLGSAALAPDDANRLGAFIALKTTPTTVKGVDEPDARAGKRAMARDSGRDRAARLSPRRGAGRGRRRGRCFERPP